MDWSQVLFLFFANASLIVWFHSESRNDYKHLDTKMDENRRETRELIQAIHLEMKEFHGRLCAIEERKRSEK